jgi:hypothetical protein
MFLLLPVQLCCQSLAAVACTLVISRSAAVAKLSTCWHACSCLVRCQFAWFTAGNFQGELLELLPSLLTVHVQPGRPHTAGYYCGGNGRSSDDNSSDNMSWSSKTWVGSFGPFKVQPCRTTDQKAVFGTVMRRFL